MQDHVAPDHGFVSPWFTSEEKRHTEKDYFPDDYPIDERLVTLTDQDAAMRNALDVVGAAFRRYEIDFHTAAELSDMIKAAHPNEIMRQLMSAWHDN